MSDQQVDHLEEAKLQAKLGSGCRVDDPAAFAQLQLAQAHASIAIAEELRGIGEALRAIAEPGKFGIEL